MLSATEPPAIPRAPAFSPAEYARRVDAVRAGMAKRGLDALLLVGAHSVNYLSGMDSENWFDFQCLIVTPDLDPALVIFDFELARWENSSVVGDVRTYGPADDPIAAVRDAVRSLGLGHARLGVEQATGIAPAQFERLRAALPAGVEDPFGIVEDVRLVKSEPELEYMRRAAALTDAAVEAGFSAVAEGVHDHDVAAAITADLYRGGSDLACWGPVVAAGYRSGSAHSNFCGHRIAAGETVFLELTGEVRRYTAPLMRTAVLGEPGPQLRVVEEAVQATLATIMREARAGQPASAVARAAGEALRPALDAGMVFHHNFGYPVGLGYPMTWIEQLGFFIQTSNDRPLEAGMAFHLPMSLRSYGAFACNLSQTVVVGEDGARPLTHSPAALRVIR